MAALNAAASAAMVPAAVGPRLRQGLTVAFEGNIGVGKSTLLSRLQQHLEASPSLGTQVAVLPEPLHRWRDVLNTGANILDEFYKQPKRFAYTFQNFVFLTRFQQFHEGATSHPLSLRLAERSLFTDGHVFAPASIHSGLFSKIDAAVYWSWYPQLLHMLPNVVPDAFVYLRAEPQVCLGRIKKRQRGEEGGINLDYLQQLHDYHEKWFHLDTSQRIWQQSQGRIRHLEVREFCSHGILNGVPFATICCNKDAQEDGMNDLLLNVETFLTKLYASKQGSQ